MQWRADGAGRVILSREGRGKKRKKHIRYVQELCSPCQLASGIAAVPKEKFELLKWTSGVPARGAQGPALACDLLLPPCCFCYTGILRLITRRGLK